MAGVGASRLGAKEKYSAPRVWPWCRETKSMARERRSTWGRPTEHISGSQDSRGQINVGPPDGARQRVQGLTRTGAQGERRAGARGCDPQGI